MSSGAWREGGLRAVATRLTDGLLRGEACPHHIVCGDTTLAHQLIRELLEAGQVRVTVLLPRIRPVRSAGVDRIRGVRVVRADRMDEAALRAAGLATAQAIALTDSDDAANLHLALCAREINPDARLVVQMFNGQLARGTSELLPGCAVLSEAALSAPTFVAAALGSVEPTHVRLHGCTVVVAPRAEVRPDEVICGLAVSGEGSSTRLLPADEDQADLVLARATGRSTGTQREALRLARLRRWRRPLAGVWWAAAPVLRRATGVALVLTLLAIVGGGISLALTHDLGLWDTVYRVLITMAGGVEPEPNTTGAQQAAHVALSLPALALVPLLTATVVEAVVHVRLARDRSRLRHPWSEHIVVVGLGNVGMQVVRQLRDLGVDVVAIEKNPAVRGVEVARALNVPVIVGDAAHDDALTEAWVTHCRALVVLSTDDKANLQTALAGQGLRPDLRVVLRLFDHDFAARVQKAFRTTVSRSVAAVSAPTFAARMLARDVRATIAVERHVLLIAEVTVEAGGALAGAPVLAARLPGLVRVLAVRGSDGPAWNPHPGRRLRPGDQVVVVARRAGLAWLNDQTAPPPVFPQDGLTPPPAPGASGG